MRSSDKELFLIVETIWNTGYFAHQFISDNLGPSESEARESKERRLARERIGRDYLGSNLRQ